jgi:hypothetical protein
MTEIKCGMTVGSLDTIGKVAKALCVGMTTDQPHGGRRKALI